MDVVLVVGKIGASGNVTGAGKDKFVEVLMDGNATVVGSGGGGRGKGGGAGKGNGGRALPVDLTVVMLLTSSSSGYVTIGTDCWVTGAV
uniref:Uncharacterized protein n=1 Tax=Pieris brassicae granulosis virus TaxID=10465 RepID=A0A7G9U8N8_GVPB|nr:hypothetical protein [Pieris brassicae granulovirus]